MLSSDSVSFYRFFCGLEATESSIVMTDDSRMSTAQIYTGGREQVGIELFITQIPLCCLQRNLMGGGVVVFILSLAATVKIIVLNIFFGCY